MAIYTRTFTTTCPNDLLKFINEDTSVPVLCLQIIQEGSTSIFEFEQSLTSAQETALDNILNVWECPEEQIEISPEVVSIYDEQNQTTTTFAFVFDSFRNKTLSLDSYSINYAVNQLNNNSWISLGGGWTWPDPGSGFIMPYNGTFISGTFHKTTSNGPGMGIHLYINNNNMGSLFFASSGGELSIRESFNIDFIAGAKIRLRAQGGGKLENITISLLYKWRLDNE